MLPLARSCATPRSAHPALPSSCPATPPRPSVCHAAAAAAGCAAVPRRCAGCGADAGCRVCRTTLCCAATPLSAASTRRTPSKTSAPVPVSAPPLPSAPAAPAALLRLARPARCLPPAACRLLTLGCAWRAGRITRYLPAGGPFTRMDSHVYADYLVPPSYDSLLGKVQRARRGHLQAAPAPAPLTAPPPC